MPRRYVTPLVFGLFVFAHISALHADDQDLARELPRVKPVEPTAALATFRMHTGFKLIPVATEPLVTDPVAAVYDADGRLYVVEMRGYPYPEKVASGNVRRLEDTDGDGIFDKSTIFLDGLSWPTSIVPYDGGVFIAVVPDIVYAKDTDGDGKADVRKVVFTGFGDQNVQGLLNGLLWGLDGWIYGVSGGNGGDIKNLAHPERPPVSVRGRDFRFRPDASVFEAISGGGQFGHTFDDWGHRFTCNNSNHIRQLVFPGNELDRNPAYSAGTAIIDIPVEGGAAPVFRVSAPEPWRIVRTRQRAADPEMVKRLPPTELVPIGFFTSASGVTIYRGTAFDPAYRGNAFIGDVGGNLVHRKTLERAGSVFRATRADRGVEFLASTDNWFRPVNFANTPDGTLLILDMYRETIEHPASIPEPIKKHLDLTSGHDRGRIYNLVPDAYRRRTHPALSRASTAQLVALLDDRDAWWRETAQRLVLERPDAAAIPLLRKLSATAETSAVGRSHALWTLADLKTLRADDLAPHAASKEPGLREQVARLAGALARENQNVSEILTRLAADEDPMVRLQVAISLGDVRNDQALPPLAKIAVRDGADPWIRAAVLSGLEGRSGKFLEALLNDPEKLSGSAGRRWLEELSTLVATEGPESEIKRIVGRFVTPESDPAIALAVSLGLKRGVSRFQGGKRPDLNQFLGGVIGPLQQKAATLAMQEDADPAVRIDAIRIFALGSAENAIDTLVPLLDAKYPNSIQLAALQTLGEHAGAPVARAIVGRWLSLGPTTRREAAEILLSRAAWASVLLDALEANTIATAELDPARLAQLRKHPDESIRARLTKLLGSQSRPDRAKVIAAYRPALELRNDASRGKDVFKRNCATCHKAEGQGVDVGPDLATITGRTPEDLLIHILDPNREVPPTYVNYTLATIDGRVISGLIASETAGAVTLKRAEGATELVPRAQIEALTSTGLSLMPENLDTAIDAQAMADLIAYLKSLQRKPQ
jgi:putative membrane-bound dehydrogenase-like protein